MGARMRNWVWGWLWIALGGFCTWDAAPAQASDVFIEGKRSDSGIKGPSYEQIEQELISLESAFPQTAERIVYGVSVQGRPLNLLKVARKQIRRRGNRYAAFMSGSTHGDEYLNIEDRLPRWFLQADGKLATVTRYLDQGGVLYLVPIFNPDGYSARSRYNANGRDLNRDFTVARAKVKGFTQPETAQMVAYLAADLQAIGARLSLTVDYHCCIGALLYPWSFRTSPPIPEEDHKAHQFLGQLMQAQFGKDYAVGTTPDILGYDAKGTSKDSYYENFGARSFTFEGARYVEKDKFELHARWWESMLRYMVR